MFVIVEAFDQWNEQNMTTSRTTTDASKKLKLTADRSAISAEDRNDLSYVAVEVVDASGRQFACQQL